MTLSTGQAVATIAVMAGVTFLTRLLPFLLFGRGERPPAIILYLGRVLPPAVIAMLVVYCLRNVSVASYPHGIPELIACAVVVGLHVWKRNNLLSIFSGTAVYMILVQFVFQ
ncbi:branched-chain amino acid transporter permease [Papillibacter cinnamivorans]|uniref:Branched-chain amino acid transport protein AzlD n=1 Tax=Papillibacter cinnamivorans DSM 12816 TaxID=1122930 RepID=A0A1W2A490_9FIRM|nr:branched-chain amino acid transporter permease [Papillibacter cinnamivorans]SMC55282.1 Branched-chain amino acid transport protein AzlD [Papillibacter cinnamivorans DSM 12816]